MLSLLHSDFFLTSVLCAEPFMNLWSCTVPQITPCAASSWDGSGALAAAVSQ